jgi:shikimate kinase
MATAAIVGRYLVRVSDGWCQTRGKTDHRATLPSLGTVLAADVTWAAAASSIDITLRARVDVVKSLWRTRVDVRRRKDMLMVV